jgi:two-component system, NarL family, response regulator NreC
MFAPRHDCRYGLRRCAMMSEGSYRILLVDDHTPFRDALRMLLELTGDLKVVGEASDGLEALALLDKVRPNIVILDISMPNLGGIQTTHQIKKLNAELKVLILTAHNHPEYLHRAMVAGADGYVLKEDLDTDLFLAIEKIRQGGVYFSPQLSKKRADRSE